MGMTIKDANQTTPIHQSSRIDWNNTYSAALPTVTTTIDDCLLIYGVGADSGLAHPRIPPNVADYVAKSVYTTIVQMYVSMGVQAAAGITPSGAAKCQRDTEGGNTWIIAIPPNATVGSMPVRMQTGSNRLCTRVRIRSHQP